MTVLSCDTIDAGEIKVGAGGVRTVVDQYRAICSSLDDGLLMLMISLPHLQRYQPYAGDPSLYVESFEASQEAGAPLWTIRVSYTDAKVKNPLEAPAVITMRSQSASAYTLVDHQGQVMLNTAGDLFEPQERKERIWVFSIKKNVANYPAWLLDYPECINSDAVRIRGLNCPPKTLALAAISIDDYVEENDVRYLPLSMELHFRRSTWQTFVPSRGLQELHEQADDAGGPPTIEKRRIMLKTGEPATEPQLLDRDGRWISDPTPEAVYLLSFQIPEDKPFSVLPLK